MLLGWPLVLWGWWFSTAGQDGLVEPFIREAPSPEHPFLLHHAPAADLSRPLLGRHKCLEDWGINHSSVVKFTANGFLKCTAGPAYCPTNLELLVCR